MTRFALQTVTVALGIVAASASVVVRQEECRSAGVRCAGAPGQEFVPYDMCCDGLSCSGAGTEYGLFCIDVENPGEFTVSDTPVPASEGDDVVTGPPATTEAAATEAAATEAVEGGEETVTTVAADAGEGDSAEGEEEGSEDSAVAVGGATGTTEEPSVTGTESAAEDSTADASSEEDDGTTPLTAGTVTDSEGDEAEATDEDDDIVTPGGLAEASDDEDAEVSPIGGRASATDEDDDDDDSVCFPAGATVELQSGEVVSMDSLAIGDVVKVGVNQYSRVFMFTHKMADVKHKFVTLKTESGASLTLTDGHYLYVNGALVAAKTVNVGDVLTLGNGESSSVVAVGSTSDSGLFNPQTVNGNVVVDGVLASTYTTAVEPSFAHAILAPFRMFNNFGFQFTALESGGGIFADVAPRGQAAF